MKFKFTFLSFVAGAIGLSGCGIVHDHYEYELESPSDTTEIRHYKSICVNQRNGAACYYVYEKGTYLSDEMRDKYLQTACSLGYKKACELKLGEREVTSEEEKEKFSNHVISLRKQLHKKYPLSPDYTSIESDIYSMFEDQIIEDCGYRISLTGYKFYENGKKCNLTKILTNPFKNRKIKYSDLEPRFNERRLEYTFFNYIPNNSVSVFYDNQHYKIKPHPAIKFLNEEQGTFTIDLNELKKIYKSKVDSKPFFATAEPNLYLFMVELTEEL